MTQMIFVHLPLHIFSFVLTWSRSRKTARVKTFNEPKIQVTGKAQIILLIIMAQRHLVTLQIRKKWLTAGPKFAIGDLVLLAEENMPPLSGKWLKSKNYSPAMTM